MKAQNLHGLLNRDVHEKSEEEIDIDQSVNFSNRGDKLRNLVEELGIPGYARSNEDRIDRFIYYGEISRLFQHRYWTSWKSSSTVSAWTPLKISIRQSSIGVRSTSPLIFVLSAQVISHKLGGIVDEEIDATGWGFECGGVKPLDFFDNAKVESSRRWLDCWMQGLIGFLSAIFQFISST